MTTSKQGLILHPDNTKILHNVTRARGRTNQGEVQIANLNIEVLPPSAATNYLGRKISFENFQTLGVENRVAAAWKKFWTFKQEMTSKTYALQDRLRPFEGTVTPTLLYGSATWTLTKQTESTIRRTQRRMLRMMIGSPRRQLHEPHLAPDLRNIQAQSAINNPNTQSTSVPQKLAATHNYNSTRRQTDNSRNTDDSSNDDVESKPAPVGDNDGANDNDDVMGEDNFEPWPEWIKRTTREAEGHLAKTGMEDGLVQHRRRKWRWAQRISTQDRQRWSRLVIDWEPQYSSDQRGARQRGHPRKRWADDLHQYLQYKNCTGQN